MVNIDTKIDDIHRRPDLIETLLLLPEEELSAQERSEIARIRKDMLAGKDTTTLSAYLKIKR